MKVVIGNKECEITDIAAQPVAVGDDALDAVAGEDFVINFNLTDTNEKIMLQYHNTSSESADLTITCPKNALVFIIQHNTNGINASMKLEGDATKLQLILDNLNQFSFANNAKFNIAEP